MKSGGDHHGKGKKDRDREVKEGLKNPDDEKERMKFISKSLDDKEKKKKRLREEEDRDMKDRD